VADEPDAAATGTGAREAFSEHLKAKAAAARRTYGPSVDADAILRMLRDREVVRYPTTIEYDVAPLHAHEFACPLPLGFHPSDGFCLFVHPHFERQPENLPLLVAYHIPSINYGGIVEPQHAELYGATLLGLEVETYYRALCGLADSIPRPSGRNA
jgi:hypothetical protein